MPSIPRPTCSFQSDDLAVPWGTEDGSTRCNGPFHVRCSVGITTRPLAFCLRLSDVSARLPWTDHPRDGISPYAFPAVMLRRHGWSCRVYSIGASFDAGEEGQDKSLIRRHLRDNRCAFHPRSLAPLPAFSLLVIDEALQPWHTSARTVLVRLTFALHSSELRYLRVPLLSAHGPYRPREGIKHS